MVAIAACALAFAFFVVWLLQLRTCNANMIDPAWAAGIGMVAIFVAIAGTGAVANRIVVAIGGAAWGSRLTVHLWRRNYRKPEDPRYRQFRDNWGRSATRNLFWLFQLQALTALLLAVAFFVPASSMQAASRARILGAAAVWAVAVGGEALADRQLARFIADENHRGQVLSVGLWRYSRHPNYFFECLHWLAYTVLSIGLPWGWLTVTPPLLMAWLLMKVSGLPLLEARLAATRAGYSDYMRTTSPLIPWPPTRSASAHDERH
nr:DUF1295 domain-containing protein [Trinickia dinghuensis]